MNDRRQMKLNELVDGPAEQTEDSDAIVCPTCGKNDFDTEHGLKIHHTAVHDDRSLTLEERVEFECERCGSTKQLPPDEAERRRFCTDPCKNEWQSEAYSDEAGPRCDGGKSTAVYSYCGATEERFLSHVNQINFCRDSCEADWKSENRAGEANPNYSQFLRSVRGAMPNSFVRNGESKSSSTSSVTWSVTGYTTVRTRRNSTRKSGSPVRGAAMRRKWYSRYRVNPLV